MLRGLSTKALLVSLKQQSEFIGWNVAHHGGGYGGDIDFLKRLNPIHSLDTGFRFDDSFNEQTQDDNHDYYIDCQVYGERKFDGSCTGIIKKCLHPFVRQDAYDGMVRNGRISDPESKYAGMGAEEVFEKWDREGKEARTYGTRMHKEIEKFYNNCADWTTSADWLTDPNVSPSLKRFIEFHVTEVVGKLALLRTEQNIWSRRYEFAGQCDILFQRVEWLNDPVKCKWVIIGDWKRTKKDLHNQTAYRGKKMLGAAASLDEVSLNEYRLQMTFYGHVLQERTDYVVKEMYVGAFHENNPTYVWKKIEPVWGIVKTLLTQRRQSLLHKYTELQAKHSHILADIFDEEADESSMDLDSLRERRDASVEILRKTSLALRDLLTEQSAFGATDEAVYS